MKVRLALALLALASPAFAQSLPTPNLGCAFKINGTSVGCPAAVAVGGTGVATITGLIKGNGTSPFSAAVAGTDYLAPTGNGSGLIGLLAAQIGGVPAGVLKGSGGVFVAATDGTDFLSSSIGVKGPASAVSGNVAAFNGTTGKLIQDGGKALPAGTILGTTDTQPVTNKDLTGAGNTFPTFNQSTTGNSATATKLATARNIAGVAFDGTANINLTSGAGIQKGNGSGGFAAATAGTDYAAPTTTVSVGTGLTGGGDLSTNRTISLDPTQFGWGLRNRLFNSAMQVDQRNAGAAATLAAASGTTNYTLDRWYAYEASAGSGLTAQQTAVNSGGIGSALRIQRANASTNTNATALAQVLETAQNIDLQSKAVTLSYTARIGVNFSPTSAQITASIITGTGTDQSAAAFAGGTWTGQATCASATPTITTSFVTYVVTCTLPSGATQVGVKFNWTWAGTAGANDWIDLTNIELSPGTFTAAQIVPENRALALSKKLCQRFYEQRSLSIRMFASSASVFYEENVQYDMRTTPTASLITAGTRLGGYGAILVNPVDATGARFGMGLTTAVGDAGTLGDIWAFIAEL